MEKLSEATGGKSWVMQSNEDMANITEQIMQTIQSSVVAIDTYPLFSLNKVLILILIGRMMVITIWRRMTRHKNK